jgi:hypothetical protein
LIGERLAQDPLRSGAEPVQREQVVGTVVGQLRQVCHADRCESAQRWSADLREGIIGRSRRVRHENSLPLRDELARIGRWELRSVEFDRATHLS